MNSLKLKSILILLIILSVSNIHLSQTLNLQTIPGAKTQVGFTFDKQFFDNDIDPTALSGIYQLNLDIPVSTTLNIIGNIQYLNLNYEYDYGYGPGSTKESGLGNIFVGLQTNPEIENNRRSILTFGLYLPTADEDVAILGALSNYYDVLKYMSNSLGLYFNYAYHKSSEEGLSYLLEIGPNVLVPTKDNGGDTEILIHFGGGLGYQVDKLLLNAEFLGVAIVTEDPDTFGDRFINSLNIGAQWKGETITPKIFYRYCFDEDVRDIITGVLGLGVSVNIN